MGYVKLYCSSRQSGGSVKSRRRLAAPLQRRPDRLVTAGLRHESSRKIRRVGPRSLKPKDILYLEHHGQPWARVGTRGREKGPASAEIELLMAYLQI